jgi:chitodextrinase
MDDGVITVPVNKSFTYTLNSNRTADIGAMTIFMSYDQNRFEVEQINSSIDGMKYTIRDGKIAVAWSNTSVMSVNNNDPVLSIQMKVKESISEPVQVFTINTGSEFADAFGIRFDNFDLKLASILTTGAGEFSVMNYPNPFQNTTQIVYNLPEQGHVKLTVTNMYGVVLSTLVNTDQAAGSYTVKVIPSELNMKSGVYLYQIEVNGTTNTYSKTGKMLFTR